MISLVGEQPVPNLLAVLHAQPEHAVFVCTERTKGVSERLRSVLRDCSISVKAAREEETKGSDDLVEVHPYDMVDIESKLKMVIKERNWSPDKIIFNLTGGTKPMALAAYRLAEQFSSPFLYVQSEGKKSVVYHYRFFDGAPVLERVDEVPPVLNIDLYLRVHLGEYTEGEFKNDFEKRVAGVLQQKLDQIKTSVKPTNALEIDLVLRCGNRVGIAEVKSGNKALSKEGIDQLNTAAEPRFLGTYTKKFLILDREYGSNNLELARAHGITVIELPSAQKGELSEEDMEKLIQTVTRELGG